MGRKGLVASAVVCSSLGFGVGAVFSNEVLLRPSSTPRSISSENEHLSELAASIGFKDREIAELRAALEESRELLARSAPASGLRTRAIAAPSAADPALLAAQQRIRELEAQLAELAKLAKIASGDKAPLDDRAMDLELAARRQDFSEALANKDAVKAISIMKALAKLDPRAFPALVDMWKSMEDQNWFGLGGRERRGWASAELFRWALDPEGMQLSDSKLQQDFQAQAVMYLAWYEEDLSKKAESYARFLDNLPMPVGGPKPREGQGFSPDSDVFRSALRNLASIPTEAASQVLARIAGNAAAPIDVRITALEGLSRQGDPSSLKILKQAIQDPDTNVRTAAEISLVRREKPVQGWLITNVNRETQAERLGIQPGSVITEYNGKPVRSMEDLFRLRREAAGQQVNMTVYRNGNRQVIPIQGGDRIGVEGEVIRPEGQN
jgi:HEAT repeat protein